MGGIDSEELHLDVEDDTSPATHPRPPGRGGLLGQSGRRRAPSATLRRVKPRGRRASGFGPSAFVLGVLALLAAWRFPLSSDGLLIHRTAESLAFEGTFRLPLAGPGMRLDPFYFQRVPGGVTAVYPPLASILRAGILRAAGAVPEPIRGRAADAALVLLPILFAAATVLPLTALFRIGGLGRRRARRLAPALILATFLGPLGSSDGHEPMLVFLLSLALAFALVARRTPGARGERYAALSGLAAGAALLTKPTAWVLLPALFVAALWPRSGRGKRRATALALAFLPGLLAFFALNAIRYGNALESGYSGQVAHPLARSAPLLWTFLRLTVLPNRGLLFFAPLVLLGLFGVVALARRSPRRPDLLSSALAAGAFFGVNLLWWAWESGMGWGPRLAAPAVALAAPLIAWGARERRALTSLLLVAGAAFNLSGYLVDTGRIYEEVAARSSAPPPLGPAVPIHLNSAGVLHPFQRVHYVPSCATWIVAPQVLLHLTASDASLGHDAALVRLALGAPLFRAAPDSGSLLLQESMVTAPVEPRRALRLALQALAFGAPVPDACAVASYLALRGGDARLAEALCRRGLAAAPDRADLRGNFQLAIRARGDTAP